VRVPWDACMAALRRVGPHRRFHAPGTMSRLPSLWHAMYVAKDLKGMHCACQLLLIILCRLSSQYSEVCLSRFTFFRSLF
jgi:hypothetical protein